MITFLFFLPNISWEVEWKRLAAQLRAPDAWDEARALLDRFEQSLAGVEVFLDLPQPAANFVQVVEDLFRRFIQNNRANLRQARRGEKSLMEDFGAFLLVAVDARFPADMVDRYFLRSFSSRAGLNYAVRHLATHPEVGFLSALGDGSSWMPFTVLGRYFLLFRGFYAPVFPVPRNSA